MTISLTVSPTPAVVMLDGVECRVWTARDDTGRTCHLFVHRVGTDDPVLQSIFDAELLEQPHPLVIETRR